MDTVATALRLPQALRASHLFGQLEDADLARLASSSFRRSLVRGERLWSAGDEPKHFFVITSGLMKIVRPGADGGIVGILGPRESLGVPPRGVTPIGRTRPRPRRPRKS